MQKKFNIKDVARKAGVSIGTVSNALNSPHLVKKEKLEKIQSVIDELNYIPNASARTLRSGKQRLVSVIVPEISNPFFIEAANVIERELYNRGYIMMLSSSNFDLKKERQIINYAIEQGVYGILYTPPKTLKHDYIIKLSNKNNTKLVFFDSQLQDDQKISSVFIDNIHGSFLALEHLIKLGHKKILMINGPEDIEQSQSRLNGAIKACEKYKITNFCNIYTQSYSVESGFAAILQNFRKNKYSAIFCANDVLAIGAMIALRCNNINIPEDVSIVGFDDVPIASQLITPLTTIHQPMDVIAKNASKLLFSNQYDKIKVKPKLIVRNSTKLCD